MYLNKNPIVFLMNLIIITISSYTYITFAVPKEKEVTIIEKSVEKNTENISYM